MALSVKTDQAKPCQEAGFFLWEKRMTPQTEKRHIEIYDTTLRDGTQGQGVSLSLVDKLKITRRLDALGVDFIEGGYPLSNPKDQAYFEQVRDLDLQHAKVCAFGMTRRRGIHAREDAGMQALVGSQAPVITIVGKTWDLHVDEVLRVERDENLAMIRDSVGFCAESGPEVFYDAEHFFDGYRANPQYAIQTLEAAIGGGATRLILCDTNGGSLPSWVLRVTKTIQQKLGEAVQLGVHTHNDAGLAVANTLAAVEAGCAQVQGTINGIGERCGNADLTTIAANLQLKMGDRYTCLQDGSLARLTEISRYVYELANQSIPSGQPYVGTAAFAHKGGMHVHAVQRISHSYEHVTPDSVGNTRRILVSELSGASNIVATLGEKFNIADDKELQRKVLARVVKMEHQGFEFEAAEASFELLLHEAMNTRKQFWELVHYRCVIFRRNGEPPITEAIVKLNVNGQIEHCVAEGDGPVNALDGALRQCLLKHYPAIEHVHLRDYKVRVVNPTAESAAKVRVLAQFSDRGNEKPKYFSTVGVNENIVDASWQAITDALTYYLLEVC